VENVVSGALDFGEGSASFAKAIIEVLLDFDAARALRQNPCERLRKKCNIDQPIGEIDAAYREAIVHPEGI
jgi:hypothetical protein